MNKPIPPNPHHPAVAAAPKTLREAVERIVATHDAGKLGRMAYRLMDQFCAIGCLLTPEQHDHIASWSMNTYSAHNLDHAVGQDNLDFMTCMTPHQRRVIQLRNDISASSQKNLILDLRLLLKDGWRKIGGIIFDLN